MQGKSVRPVVLAVAASVSCTSVDCDVASSRETPDYTGRRVREQYQQARLYEPMLLVCIPSLRPPVGGAQEVKDCRPFRATGQHGPASDRRQCPASRPPDGTASARGERDRRLCIALKWPRLLLLRGVLSCLLDVSLVALGALDWVWAGAAAPLYYAACIPRRYSTLSGALNRQTH